MSARSYMSLYEDASQVRRLLPGAGSRQGHHSIPGPVVSIRQVWLKDAYGERRIYVEHVGRGAPQAMAQYREILEAAGWWIGTGTLSGWVSNRPPKEFLWVKGKSQSAAAHLVKQPNARTATS